jgi:hypothetical protein
MRIQIELSGGRVVLVYREGDCSLQRSVGGAGIPGLVLADDEAWPDAPDEMRRAADLIRGAASVLARSQHRQQRARIGND